MRASKLNERSSIALAAHAKYGIREVAEFSHSGVEYGWQLARLRPQRECGRQPRHSASPFLALSGRADELFE